MEVTVPANWRTRTAIFSLFEIIEPKHGALRQSCLASVLGQALGIGGHVVDDQCTQTILGAFGSGASGSSIIRTRLLVPSGTPSHASGGETSSPSQVYFEGMWPFCLNAGEFRVIAIAAPPQRIIRILAKRMTTRLEF